MGYCDDVGDGAANRDTKFQALMCPSDPNAGTAQSAIGEGMRANYLCFTGPTDNFTYPTTGAFGPWSLPPFNQKINGLKDLVDGTSNTMLVAEMIVGVAGQDKRGGIFNACQGNSFISAAFPPNTPVGDVVEAGRCVTPTPYNPCVNTGGTFNASARSYHAGGVHALLGDGTVRFLSNVIDVNTYKALSTKANADVVGEY